MTKYTFTQIYDDQVTTKEFEADYLYDVIERFEEFLRGCGFYFNGRLEIVDEDDQLSNEPEIGESFTVSFSDNFPDPKV
jgi:hypothetical protein